MPKQPLNLHHLISLQKIDISTHLKLKPLQTGDAAAILAILAADETIRQRVTVASRLHTPTDVDKEVVRYRADAGLIRYVLWKGTCPAGMVSLWRDDGFFGTQPHPDDYGFGYFLDPGERGQGLATQAVQALMGTVVQVVPVKQFVAFCEDGNVESIAVLKRLGFTPTNQVFPEPNHGWLERKYVKEP